MSSIIIEKTSQGGRLLARPGVAWILPVLLCSVGGVFTFSPWTVSEENPMGPGTAVLFSGLGIVATTIGVFFFLVIGPVETSWDDASGLLTIERRSLLGKNRRSFHRELIVDISTGHTVDSDGDDLYQPHLQIRGGELVNLWPAATPDKAAAEETVRAIQSAWPAAQ